MAKLWEIEEIKTHHCSWLCNSHLLSYSLGVTGEQFALRYHPPQLRLGSILASENKLFPSNALWISL